MQTKLYKIPKFGVNRPNNKQDTTIWKCQNLPRNVWSSMRTLSTETHRPDGCSCRLEERYYCPALQLKKEISLNVENGGVRLMPLYSKVCAKVLIRSTRFCAKLRKEQAGLFQARKEYDRADRHPQEYCRASNWMQYQPVCMFRQLQLTPGYKNKWIKNTRLKFGQ